jgi:hypothetical protein
MGGWGGSRFEWGSTKDGARWRRDLAQYAYFAARHAGRFGRGTPRSKFVA